MNNFSQMDGELADLYFGLARDFFASSDVQKVIAHSSSYRLQGFQVLVTEKCQLSVLTH